MRKCSLEKGEVGRLGSYEGVLSIDARIGRERREARRQAVEHEVNEQASMGGVMGGLVIAVDDTPLSYLSTIENLNQL